MTKGSDPLVTLGQLIMEPMSTTPLTDDERFMELALEQARECAQNAEVPIGAIVVCDDKPVARAGNRRETDRDPAAHAEFLAIGAAARALDRWRLSDCTVYVTLEPCVMCAGLMQQARIKRCVYGAADPKAGALGTLYDLHDDARLNHRFAVTPGVLADQSAALLRDFFSARRSGGCDEKKQDTSYDDRPNPVIETED